MMNMEMFSVERVTHFRLLHFAELLHVVISVGLLQ